MAADRARSVRRRRDDDTVTIDTVTIDAETIDPSTGRRPEPAGRHGRRDRIRARRPRRDRRTARRHPPRGRAARLRAGLHGRQGLHRPGRHVRLHPAAHRAVAAPTHRDRAADHPARPRHRRDHRARRQPGRPRPRPPDHPRAAARPDDVITGHGCDATRARRPSPPPSPSPPSSPSWTSRCSRCWPPGDSEPRAPSARPRQRSRLISFAAPCRRPSRRGSLRASRTGRLTAPGAHWSRSRDRSGGDKRRDCACRAVSGAWPRPGRRGAGSRASRG